MGNDHQYGGTRRPAEETLDKTGRQTPQQAALTRQDGGGEAGRMPTAIGGSSQGQSDQNAGRGPDRKVAGGLYETERTGGRGDDADAARSPVLDEPAAEAERGKS